MKLLISYRKIWQARRSGLLYMPRYMQTFMAVAPGSMYTLPTTTVVMIPEPPVPVTNGCPEPSSVMTGRTVSGAEKRSVVAAAAAAIAAELELVDMGAVEVVALPLPLDRSAAKAAASDPQLPLTLQANVALLSQVLSDGPHGSKTVSIRMPVTDCRKGWMVDTWECVTVCMTKTKPRESVMYICICSYA